MKTETPYIVIDGQDGSGKSTQILLLSERAREREGHKLLFTAEPGGVPLTKEIRRLITEYGMKEGALTQFLLFLAARRPLLESVVWPALDVGIPVVSDRGDSSTFAYQIFAMQIPELMEAFWFMRRLMFDKHEPSLYIILDVPAEVAQARSLARAKERARSSAFDEKPIEWFERVREGFAAFARALPGRVVILDGNRPVEEIHEELYGIVSKACSWKK